MIFWKCQKSWKSWIKSRLSKIMKNHEMWQAWNFVLLNWITYMVKHGSAVSRISQAQFNAILGVGNTVIPLTLLTNRINSNVRNSFRIPIGFIFKKSLKSSLGYIWKFHIIWSWNHLMAQFRAKKWYFIQTYESYGMTKRARSKRALHIITRCCRYQIDQLSKCLIRTHGLYLHRGSRCICICYSPDVINKGLLFR